MKREIVNKIVANICYDHDCCTNIKKESVIVTIIDKFGTRYLCPIKNVIKEEDDGGIEGAIGFHSDELLEYKDYHCKTTYISCEDILTITEDYNYIDD